MRGGGESIRWGALLSDQLGVLHAAAAIVGECAGADQESVAAVTGW